MLLRHDEEQLRGLLEDLQLPYRTAFAAACAERQFPNYLRFATRTGRGDPVVLRAALKALWSDLAGQHLSNHELQRDLDRCMALMPERYGERAKDWPYADDVLASVAFALRARLTGDPQEAIWAAIPKLR